jgi:hypothetical protein
MCTEASQNLRRVSHSDPDSGGNSRSCKDPESRIVDTCQCVFEVCTSQLMQLTLNGSNVPGSLAFSVLNHDARIAIDSACLLLAA